MNYKSGTLSKQLSFIIILIFVIVFISLGIVLPKTLIPVAEKSIYSYLSEPLKLMQSDFDGDFSTSKVAYLYIINDKVVSSDNLSDVLKINDTNELIKYIKDTYGKFTFEHKTYYY